MGQPKWPSPGARYQDDAADEASQVRWQRGFEDGLAKGSLRLEPTGTRLVRRLRGACPRCGHELKPKDIYIGVLMGVTGLEHEVAVTNIICTCDKKHAGRPDGKAGCGWAPDLKITFIWPGK
jgi:hypothetical protein